MSKYKVCGCDMALVHNRMLEIVVEVDRICREQGIQYSLYGGSVLGAVRHRGFIPWDHDLDIALPRREYEKLVKYFLENTNEKLFFSNYFSEETYPNNWGKMRLNGTVFQEKELIGLPIHKGVFIDVHPIDNIFPAVLKLQVKLTMFWSCVGKVKSGRYNGPKIKRSVYKLFSFLSHKTINRFRDFCMKLFSRFQTNYVYKVAHPNYGIYPIPRCTFEELTEHEFEGKMLFIPRNYDEFLRKRYGDYREIPPEAERYECCTTIVECNL